MCGGEAVGPEWETTAIPRPHDKRYGIRCTQCNIRLLGETKESVVKAWNNRPGEKAARVEALEEVKKRLRGAIKSSFGLRVFDTSIDKLILETKNAD
ncbi:hypothetical protein LCGC14_0601730 [marine sediment metagenome]|uniref:Uncharacterized protein n=1 Tax=marine sediment metagenome TaxID=412755 RepID=A0A0F9TWC9_9ZZZZ